MENDTDKNNQSSEDKKVKINQLKYYVGTLLDPTKEYSVKQGAFEDDQDDLTVYEKIIKDTKNSLYKNQFSSSNDDTITIGKVKNFFNYLEEGEVLKIFLENSHATNINETEGEELTKKLKEKNFRRCIENETYKTHELRAIYENKEFNTIVEGHLSKVSRKIWGLLVGSILEGEFLYIGNYSEILSEIVQEIDKKYSNDPTGNRRLFIPPIIPTLRNLLIDLLFACRIMHSQISEIEKKDSDSSSAAEKEKQDSSQRRVVTFKTEDPLKRELYIRGSNSLEHRQADIFEKIMNLLISMTLIDFCYIVDKEKIEKLLSLAKLCEHTKTQEEGDPVYEEYKFLHQVYGEDDLKFGNYLKAIEVKASTLIYQSIINPQKEGKYKYLKDTYFIIDDKSYETSEIDLLKKYQKEIKSLPKEEAKILLTTEESGDLEKYNKFIKQSQANRSFWEKELEKIDSYSSISQIKNNSSLMRKDDIPIVGLLRLIKNIRALYKNESQENSSINMIEYTEVLGNTLKKLQDFISKYRDITPAYEKKLEFHSSFYKIDDVNIFISSYGDRPINITYLESIYREANMVYREWLVEMMQREAERVSHIGENFKKTIERKLKDFKSTLDKEMSNTKRENISLLGLFAAIMAFVSTTVGSFKIVNSIWELLIVTGSVYALMGLMASFLFYKKVDYYVSEYYNKGNGKTRREESRTEIEDKDLKSEDKDLEPENQDAKANPYKNGYSGLIISIVIAIALVIFGTIMKQCSQGSHNSANTVNGSPNQQIILLPSTDIDILNTPSGANSRNSSSYNSKKVNQTNSTKVESNQINSEGEKIFDGS